MKESECNHITIAGQFLSMSYRVLLALRRVLQLDLLPQCPKSLQSIQINKVPFAFYKTGAKQQSKNSVQEEFKTEEDVVYLADPDTFGTLSRFSYRPPVEDEGDRKEEKFLEDIPLPSQKLSTTQYADLIKQYIKHKRLKEAIDVLEVKMIAEDRVKPENYIYNILIGACADVGYTKKAFKLYNDMKRRALKVTGDTYTCLFGACANSPWPADGLKNANHLRQLMKEKSIEPNLTNYNAMIKAFGRCGDLSTAFQIVDEMIAKKMKVRVHTFNFLLQSCISDKESGLRHALHVWRKMLVRREKPNIFSFNLMLKCVKDCNFGSKENIMETISALAQTAPWDFEAKRIQNKPLLLETNNKTPEIHLTSTDNELSDTSISEKAMIPNLLSKNLQIRDVISLHEVNTPQEKFAFIGGPDGFLQEMQVYDVKPDLKTFTQMLPLIPDTEEAENELMAIMEKMEIKADIEFYNSLMKKRCYRLDYIGAIAVKSIIQEQNKLRKKKHPMKKKLQLKLNLITYGVLAMTCKTKEDAEKLLSEMREAQIKINIEILGTMLRQGTVHSDFGYVMYIMKTARDEKLRINEVFMEHLKRFIEKCNVLKEKDPEGKRKASPIFMKTYGIFLVTYERWLDEINAEQLLKTEHPWQQFTRLQPETVQRQALIKPIKRYNKRRFKFVLPYRA